MKRSHVVSVAVVCVILWSLNSFQGAQVQPFDLRKCQQELEIMKGILRTTLGFASQELAAGLKNDKVETKAAAKRFTFGRPGDFSIGAFYLAGQGAVFTIPTSSVRDMLRARQGNEGFAFASADIKDRGLNREWMEQQLASQLNELKAQLTDNFGFEGVAGSLAAVPEPPSPPVPPAPAVSPVAPAPAPIPPQAKDVPEAATAREKQLRRKLAELQDRVKQRGEEDEARQAKFRESLSQLKVFLMEAMANHGDSLTVVKPSEYVNLVIVDEGNHWFGDDSGDRAQREILSVQKSVITDYKTGKLSLEAFKQKVSNYVN
jgi:hypothetical protein